MHLRAARAYTYLMEIEGTKESAHKIGWAFDWRARERGFNFSALPQLGGLRYRTRLFELWDTARQAFIMEQAILRQLDASRHPANREVIDGVSYDALQTAWVAQLQLMRRPRSG
jgi:hypothetical protein